MTDLGTQRVAHAVAVSVLGHDPGPMTPARSLSHHVHVGSDVAVKVIDATGHTRLDREVALVPHLPAGLTAALLAHGTYPLDGREFRYACYARVPGSAPGMELPDVGAATARSLAAQAVQRLDVLHGWAPSGPAARTLSEPVDHGGFVSRAALLAEAEAIAAADRNSVVPSALLDGLRAVAGDAPRHARVVVPVHADCHWDNWLAADGRVSALLDFEWARLGEPVDDWFFVIALSGRHRETVLDVIARETTTSAEVLRAGCEVRHAAHLASDIRLGLAHPDRSARLLTHRLSRLTQVVVERIWWRAAR